MQECLPDLNLLRLHCHVDGVHVWMGCLVMSSNKPALNYEQFLCYNFYMYVTNYRWKHKVQCHSEYLSKSSKFSMCLVVPFLGEQTQICKNKAGFLNTVLMNIDFIFYILCYEHSTKAIFGMRQFQSHKCQLVSFSAKIFTTFKRSTSFSTRPVKLSHEQLST